MDIDSAFDIPELPVDTEDVEVEQDISPPPPKLVRPLSSAQERKLVDYLEDKFLEITRNYKKR